MKLSEAIRLGSLAIQNPQKCDSRFCAIGMGLTALGKLSQTEEANYSIIEAEWPWLRQEIRDDRCAVGLLMSLFDSQVMNGDMTLEALCDQVRAWEDELESKGINVEQVTMAAELNQPASQAAENTNTSSFLVQELDKSGVEAVSNQADKLEQDVAK